MSLQTFVGQKVDGRTAASFIDLIYETQNGFMTVAVMSDKEWTTLAHALQHPEWLDDPRFKTPSLRDQNIDARLQMTQDVLKTRTTEEWLERLEAEGVPCAPVLTRDQVMTHPQVLASGILLESEHHVVGRIRQTRTAARFTGTPTAYATAPRCWASTRARCSRSSASRAATSRRSRSAASSAGVGPCGSDPTVASPNGGPPLRPGHGP
jgi:crotonobetainyl-CoA:carnitine CoA-transferase CaiB-like acyl-CoA transferase